MTWPFENDTSAVEKKLAKRSLQQLKLITAAGAGIDVLSRYERREKLAIIAGLTMLICLMVPIGAYQAGIRHPIVERLRVAV